MLKIILALMQCSKLPAHAAVAAVSDNDGEDRMLADKRRQTYLDPIFCHTINPRAAPNVTLGGRIVALIASSLMAIGSPPTAYSKSKFVALGPAAALPAKPIRVVGLTTPQEPACEKQTWPYIHQRCLRTEAKPRAVDASLGTGDGAALSPLTATGNVVVPQPVR